MSVVFIDGDFSTENECKYHCSPSCHPAQVGPEWLYGCTHYAWPQNRMGDFCPIVNCNGKYTKCEIPAKFLKAFIRGQNARIKNAKAKVQKAENELMELGLLLQYASNKEARS